DVTPDSAGLPVAPQVQQMAAIARRGQVRDELPISPFVLRVAVDDHDPAAAPGDRMVLGRELDAVRGPHGRGHRPEARPIGGEVHAPLGSVSSDRPATYFASPPLAESCARIRLRTSGSSQSVVPTNRSTTFPRTIR